MRHCKNFFTLGRFTFLWINLLKTFEPRASFIDWFLLTKVGTERRNSTSFVCAALMVNDLVSLCASLIHARRWFFSANRSFF